MAQVSLDITEYDGLKNRIVELEGMYKETKDREAEVRKLLDDIDTNRVKLTTVVKTLEPQIDWDFVEGVLSSYTQYWEASHRDHKWLHHLTIPQKQYLVSVIKKGVTHTEKLDKNVSSSYTGFDDVYQEVKNEYQEVFDKQRKSEQEIETKLSSIYKEKEEKLSAQIEQLKEQVNSQLQTIRDQDLEIQKIILEHESNVRDLEQKHKFEVEDLKDNKRVSVKEVREELTAKYEERLRKNQPVNQTLDEVLRERGMRVKRTWWGGQKLEYV